MNICLHLRQSAEVDHVRDIYSSCINQTLWSDCGSEVRACTSAVLRMVKVQSYNLRRGDAGNLSS